MKPHSRVNVLLSRGWTAIIDDTGTVYLPPGGDPLYGTRDGERIALGAYPLCEIEGMSAADFEDLAQIR